MKGSPPVSETLILASGSASRRAMLEAARVPFRIVPADIDESAIKDRMVGRDPAHIARALAEAKALAVSHVVPDALVLGGDSMVAVDGRLYSKPRSRDDAAQHLKAFSNRTMKLWSAAAIARNGAIFEAHCDQAQLHVRTLSDDFIQAYLDREWPGIAGCVGCFRIEGEGVHLFDAIEGSHFTVLGMPLLWVLGGLRRAGLLPS
jgi:septum formation protein